MKVLRNIIFGLVVIALILAVFIYNNKSNIVDENNINSVTLTKKSLSAYWEVKEIERQEDIKTICDEFNSGKYQSIEKAELDPIDGGNVYNFSFKYSSGTSKDIIYMDGFYLYIEDKIYKTGSKDFSEFWNLNYPIKKWNVKENRFESTD